MVAQQSSVDYFTRSHAEALPRLLSSQDRGYYGSLYEAIDASNWDRVEILLAQRDRACRHRIVHDRRRQSLQPCVQARVAQLVRGCPCGAFAAKAASVGPRTAAMVREGAMAQIRRVWRRAH